MTRDVNKLLGRIKINPDTLQYSDADMDKHADYITFKSEPDTLYLKPHIGLRAEAFSNKDTAKKIVEDHNKILASKRDQEIFFNALLNPDKPNENLKNAMAKYSETFGEWIYR